MEQTLEVLVADLVKHVTLTNSAFAQNVKGNVLVHPFPFFGDLSNALVATVWLNPAATEFGGGRWPTVIDAPVVTRRLIDYFNQTPHAWFSRWEEGLSISGSSYRTNAVHVDISPRAAISARAIPD